MLKINHTTYLEIFEILDLCSLAITVPSIFISIFQFYQNLKQPSLLIRWSGGSRYWFVFAASDIFRSIASVDELVESISNAAILQSWTAVYANIIMMAISRATIKFNLGVQEEIVLHLRTTEAKESLGIAIRHLIRPIASIGLRIEGQTLRTVKHVTSAIHAVHKLPAVLMIADLEVAILMRTVVGRVCRLQIRPACAVYVDRISTRIIEASFRIEE